MSKRKQAQARRRRRDEYAALNAPPPRSEAVEKLTEAVQNGRHSEVVRLLQGGVSAATCNREGASLFTLAWDLKYFSIAWAFEQAAKDQNVRLPLTATAANRQTRLYALLFESVENGWIGKAASVLALGANPNAYNDAGCTPLIIAATYGHYGVVMALLRKGALLETRDPSGNTPIMKAIEKSHAFTIGGLWEMGADLDTPNHQGETARDLFSKNFAFYTEKVYSNILEAEAKGTLDPQNRPRLPHVRDLTAHPRPRQNPRLRPRP